MKKIMKMVGLIFLVGLGMILGMGAKEYVKTVGMVDKAKLKRCLITVDEDAQTIRADCYWNLMDISRRIIAESEKTSLQITYTNAVKRAINDFLKKDLQDHLRDARLQFSDDDN